MDTYRVSAPVAKKRGKRTIVLSIDVHERSSEVIPTAEKHLMFMLAADRNGYRVAGPIKVELIG